VLLDVFDRTFSYDLQAFWGVFRTDVVGHFSSPVQCAQQASGEAEETLSPSPFLTFPSSSSLLAHAILRKEELYLTALDLALHSSPCLTCVFACGCVRIHLFQHAFAFLFLGPSLSLC
jgi:hypothetical protein